ncbi:hypothetical protein PILCRDRAFT_12260 [Piloderma croceum F 1598]|uniref:Uncharacterized protein n=1 Tax=Piloderma croceum (strain F 1598) TaxID=765440 RepID=A0A0C3EX31_PILCF|nr:hypothetical protein PILCRDRAFT_12260 [Piloderma croceum F 1598]
MFITLLLITVLTILIYLLLITQPTFHRRSYRYLGDEIRGYEYSFYFIIPLLYFQFLSGFGNLIISVDIRYFANNKAGYIKIGFRKQNDPETSTPSTPPTRPATPSPPGTSEDLTRLRVPPELRRHRRQNIQVVDDTSTSSYGIPIETSPLISESRIIDQQLVEQSVFYNAAEEPLPNIQHVSSPTPANRTSTIQRPQSPPIIVNRVRSPAPANRARVDPLFATPNRSN